MADRLERGRADSTNSANSVNAGRPVAAPVGILMLDTAFERPPGDVGNQASWPFPVLFRKVDGASARRVVYRTDPALLPAFIGAGHDLVDAGVRLITTSCGFLALYQRELSAALPVPVATSALLQLPWLQALQPAGRRVGIITASAPALTARHLAAVGVAADTPVAGFESDSHFHRVIVDGEGIALDRDQVEAELIDVAIRLCRAHPEVSALVLECTNLPPWSAALQRATGLPVHDIRSLILWLHAGLAPVRFPAA